MNFIPENIDEYAQQNTSPESDLLNKLNRQTHLKVVAPRMLSGHLQGRFLSMMSTMICPKNILEIGTYTGYSALCMAEGLSENGQLTTVEVDPEIAAFAQQYFDQSPYSKQIKIQIGNALEIIPKLEQTFDLVFIDADKSNYSNYADAVHSKLAIGGHIIADNVLWSGKVVEPIDPKDVDTSALIAFNEQITKDERYENTLLPIRDGLMVARKISN